MRVDMVRVHTGCSLLLVVVERLTQTLDFSVTAGLARLRYDAVL